MDTLLLITHPLNGVLMIAIPLGLGFYLTRRFSLGWRLWWTGAAAFVASQVGHLPFNVGLSAIFRNGYLPLPPEEWLPAFNALVGGLSAGLWEESFRYVSFRWWAKEARSWNKAILLGAGHGGIEAILLGALVLWTFIRMAALRGTDLSTLISAEQLELARQQVDMYWTLPWLYPLLGALERIFAIATHLALSVLVWQVFLRNQIRWLGIAVAWHTFVNAVVEYAATVWDPVWVMLILAVAALAGIGLLFVLRMPEPEILDESRTRLNTTQIIPLTPIPETPDKLEDSRYE